METIVTLATAPTDDINKILGTLAIYLVVALYQFLHPAPVTVAGESCT